MKKKTELIVALDTDSLAKAQAIVDELSGLVHYFKIGMELFTQSGPSAVEMVLKAKAKVFLDLKFHDIPNTVANAAISALRLGVAMFNVHILGGKQMLIRTVSAVNAQVRKLNIEKPLVLGVTVLTSIDRQQLNSMGILRSVKNEVVRLTNLCKQCGLDGVVCSGRELKLLRRLMGDKFVFVVPGVRLSKEGTDDQKRIITPREAARLSADYIVVGRPIIKADNALKAAENVLALMRDK
ncbi:MAG: orotidine-5'-phosphate decarboxylase [Candidatus Omnitrophota bacterium]|nr:MAG: orotidine-5'-phosphate decarboxylase [Candidatus Omnitrophota bacterium]